MSACVYPDWEGGYSTGKHSMDDEGFCRVCGMTRRESEGETMTDPATVLADAQARLATLAKAVDEYNSICEKEYLPGWTQGAEAAASNRMDKAERDLPDVAVLVDALAQQTARVEALERAVVTLYDDISDHVPDDVLVLVTECRAALAADKTELPAAEDD